MARHGGSTAEQLEDALGDSFFLAHGLRVSHRGVSLCLEHVAIGSGGLFLVEHVESRESWAEDLERNIAFFREILGEHADRFTCLLLPDGLQLAILPEGALLVASVEEAVDVIRERAAVKPLPAPLVEQVRRRLMPARPAHRRQPAWQRRRSGRIQPVWETANLFLSIILMAVLYLHEVDGDEITWWPLILTVATLVGSATRFRTPIQLTLTGLLVLGIAVGILLL
ncbi:MAG: hypothetical protein ACOY93_11465 [Bacillota bacterium]